MALAHWRLLWIMALSVFVSMLGVGIIVPFLPVYAQSLGAGGVMMGLIFSSFSLSRAVVVPWIGAWSDRWGRKPFITAGLLGYGATALGLFLVDSPWGLIANRTLMGCFSAMVLPVTMALMADLAPEGWEGRVMAVFNLALLAGFAVGPVVGGYAFEYLGLESNFLIMAGAAWLSCLMVLLWVREPQRLQPSAQGGVRGQLAIIADRQFLGFFLCRTGQAMGMGCFLAFLPLICQDRGLVQTQVGLLLGLNVAAMVVVQLPSGWLADRWPRIPLVVMGQSVSALAKLAWPLAHDFGTMAALSILEGLAAALALPALNALAVSRGRELGQGMGGAVGVFTLALSLGVFIGPVVGGWLTDHHGSEAAFYFGGGATLAVLPVLVWLAHGRLWRQPSPRQGASESGRA